MRRWFDRYAELPTDSTRAEFALIVSGPLPPDDALCFFASEPPPPMPVTGKGRLRSVLGRTNLTRLVSALGILDAIVADGDETPIMVHGNLYGPDELAHTNSLHISFNVANARMRRILSAVTAGSAVAVMALADLFLHEKAHVVLRRIDPAHAGHEPEFYAAKDELKRALCSRLRANPKRCPLRRARFADGWIPEPATLAAKLYGAA